MTGRAGLGRASTRPSLDDDSLERRSILSSALLIAVIVAGFVTSLGLAETSPGIAATLQGLLN